MSATHIMTPVGAFPIRPEIASQFSSLSDRDIADKALKSSPFIDPEFFAELVSRGLSWRGCTTDMTYALIAQREKAGEA